MSISIIMSLIMTLLVFQCIVGLLLDLAVPMVLDEWHVLGDLESLHV